MFTIIPRKHTEVKFGSEEDKQVCQTWKLLFKILRVPTKFFRENLKGN